jgi:hypothetical protein
MTIRRQTVERPFGTLKAWMGSTHFLTKTLDKVRTEMSLQVLAYNMKRMTQHLRRQTAHAGNCRLIKVSRKSTVKTTCDLIVPGEACSGQVFTRPRPEGDLPVRSDERSVSAKKRSSALLQGLRHVPGLRVNLNKRGASLSVGHRPARMRALYSTFSRIFAISAAEKARKVWVRMLPSLATLMESAVAEVSSGASMIDTAS